MEDIGITYKGKGKGTGKFGKDKGKSKGKKVVHADDGGVQSQWESSAEWAEEEWAQDD